MVFVHGGGFFSGGANGYGGTVFMNEDVVLVLIQYRLGLLGECVCGGGGPDYLYKSM